MGSRLQVGIALAGWCVASANSSAVSLPFEQDLADRPAAFAAPVPEGNYQVTVRITSARAGTARIWAEQRRLMADVRLRRNGTAERTFIVSVRTPALDELPENAPGGTAVRLNPREVGSASWDDRLSIAVTSDIDARLAWLRIEAVDLPTLYLAGDSTVSDQPEAPNGSWGQFLPRYFRPDMAVANHAESGESLKSFVTSHRFDKLLAKLRHDDWVMIQFGHNDQKRQWPQTHADANNTYKAWLRTYIAEVRARGATPILVTSPERRNFDTDGRIRPTLAEHAQAMRSVAKEVKAALIDLNAISIVFYESLGPAVAPRAFAAGGDDRTHHNAYGGQQLARAVIEGLRRANRAQTGGLEQHIAADAGTFDAADPPLPDRQER